MKIFQLAQLKLRAVAQCGIELQSDKVSDTTGGDSSDVAKFKVISKPTPHATVDGQCSKNLGSYEHMST
jgi:hypothetical protein